jgi:hypothetical protein
MKRAILLFTICLALFCLQNASLGGINPAGVQQLEREINGYQETCLVTIPGNSLETAATPIDPVNISRRDETDNYTGQLLWQTGDPYGMCNDCAVSPDGDWFGLGISLNNQRAELYQSLSSAPVWQFMAGEGATKVAVSEDCQVFAFNYQHYLSIFNSTSSTPLWTYDYGADAWAYTVAVSRDGSLIVGTSMIGTTGHVVAFPIAPVPSGILPSSSRPTSAGMVCASARITRKSPPTASTPSGFSTRRTGTPSGPAPPTIQNVPSPSPETAA